jgi:sugar phosphate isomerase/epimerase
MIAGYHTAGLLLHDPVVAVRELARLGYASVAIRPHGANFNPDSPNFGQQLLRLRDAVSSAGMRSVLDLDCLFLPDPLVARAPSLVAVDPNQARDALAWLTRWLELGKELGADLITFSSGARQQADGEHDETILERLSAQLRPLLIRSLAVGIPIALHPRAGDAVSTVAQFERLAHWLEGDVSLRLAADVGEMLAGGELPLADRLARNLNALACLYVCDRRAGVSGDQRIGSGDVALKRLLLALHSQGYPGHVIARVEGHSELGIAAAQEAIPIFPAGR